MRINKYHLSLGALLFVGPLSAQQTVVVPDVNVTVPVPEVTVNVEAPPPDPEAVAREEAAIRAEERIADAIEAWVENCGCVSQGSSGVTQIATAGIVFALGLIWWELRKGNTNGVDGAPGRDGADGSDGTNGQDGVDGRDGVDGQDGDDGQDSSEGH